MFPALTCGCRRANRHHRREIHRRGSRLEPVPVQERLVPASEQKEQVRGVRLHGRRSLPSRMKAQAPAPPEVSARHHSRDARCLSEECAERQAESNSMTA